MFHFYVIFYRQLENIQDYVKQFNEKIPDTITVAHGFEICAQYFMVNKKTELIIMNTYK